MILQLILFLTGLFFLIKFSSIAIEKSVKFSRLTGISEMTIGFILIAVSTSLPELTIAIFSSFHGEGLLSFGNLAGANVSNLALVFGILGFIGFTIKKKDLAKIYEAIIFTSTVAFFILVLGAVDLVVGLFLLILFYMFAKSVIKDGFNGGSNDKMTELKTIELVKSVIYLLISLAVVVISAKIITDSAIALAHMLGVTESLIGATILAVGTTLPELSVGIMAVRTKNMELAIGDGIGSIVTNLTLVLGMAAMINPIVLSASQNTLLLLLFAVNVIFLFLASRMKFGRKEGIALLLIYAAYLGIVVKFAS